MVKYKGSVYGTSTQDIALLTGGDLTAIDHDWWSNTRGHGATQLGYRHPLEIVEDTLYIGDQNNIHTWDGTTSVANAMTLPEGVNIVSLRKHPNGQNLLAFCGETANFIHTRSGGGVLYVIDTVNLEFIREIKLEAQVEGTINVGGVIYVTYGNKVGYFNGDGITPLRELTGNQNTTYSGQLGSAEGVLLIRDGKDVLAYGDLGQGNVWWRAYRTSANGGTAVTAIGYKGSNELIVGYISSLAAQTLDIVNIRSTGTAGGFYSNQYLAGQHIAIRRIEVDHTETPVSGTHAFIAELLDSAGNSKYSATTTYTNTPSQHTSLYLDAFLRGIQLKLTPSSGAMGFREIRIYGESIE